MHTLTWNGHIPRDSTPFILSKKSFNFYFINYQNFLTFLTCLTILLILLYTHPCAYICYLHPQSLLIAYILCIHTHIYTYIHANILCIHTHTYSYAHTHLLMHYCTLICASRVRRAYSATQTHDLPFSFYHLKLFFLWVSSFLLLFLVATLCPKLIIHMRKLFLSLLLWIQQTKKTFTFLSPSLGEKFVM